MNDAHRHAFVVEGELAGGTLAAALRAQDPALSWGQARKLCTTGKVRVDGAVESDGARRLEAGQRVELNHTAPRKRSGTLSQDAIVFADRDVVVVQKPAGMLSVPYAGEKDTLIDLTRAALRKQAGRGARVELGIVHRLDKDTTGLLVFTRNLAAKKHLAGQFRARTVKRHYLALVHGEVEESTYDTHLVQNRGDGLRGSWGVFRRQRGGPPEAARRAITHVEPLESLQGATLVRCRLRTGRQHQIRIHLAEAGHMLVGERVYVRDHQGPVIQAARPMLHARELGFVHPRFDREVAFDQPPPADFERCLARLRGGPTGDSGHGE